MITMEHDGPPVNLLSAGQLRLVARVKSVRPTAELRWVRDGSGWSLEVFEQGRRQSRLLLSARLDRDGTIETHDSLI